MKKCIVFLFLCLLLLGCGQIGSRSGRYEVKNVKLPYKDRDAVEETIKLRDELIRVDTRTGKVWKLQHGYSNIGGHTAEFSLWDELGNIYRTGETPIEKK